MPGWRPPALDIPQEAKQSYLLTQSGTFHEGDMSIGRAGLIIGGQRAGTPSKSRFLGASTSGLPTIAGSPSQQEEQDAAAQDVVEEGGPSLQEGESAAEVEALKTLKLEELEDHGLIGSGSSGLVRKVAHLPTGRTLVLKVIQFDVGNDVVRKQITMELRTLYDSHHAFIVRYFQAYFEGGCIIVVMEYMDGGTLAELLARLRVIEEPHLAVLARQALAGLRYLHRDLRVIHRDIKPSNLLLSSSGVLKISDFGVSGHLDSSVSRAASWVGTVTYMSPERISGSSYSFSSDIWSLGLTLLEAALGRFPYPPCKSLGVAAGLGFWDLLEMITQAEAPVPTKGGSMSDALCDFLSSALAKDPAERLSAEQLLQHPFLAAAPETGRAAVTDLVAQAAAADIRSSSQSQPFGPLGNAAVNLSLPQPSFSPPFN